MKNFITILLILTLASCKKEPLDPALTTKEFSIPSTSNGANYSIKVAVPENYDPSSQKYATIYVLDGKDNFSYVANRSKELSRQYGKANILVVSIGYGNNRAIDYTPPKEAGESDNHGGEKFMLFIKTELIPRMEAEYGADTSRQSRIILGHSFGGLLAAYAFTNFNEVFGNYLMLSPSLWYDDESLLRKEQATRSTNSQRQQLVYIGLGSLESTTNMGPPFEAFAQQLKDNYPGMKLEKYLVSGEGHMGSRNPNIVEGLNFYFQNR